MKKIAFLSFICALFIGQSAFAQQAQEVTYVEDPSQGYLFNKFSDNWFITGEGGVGFYMSPGDTNRDWYNRLSPAASIYVGKWFSPEIGVRLGVNWLQCKGLSSTADGTGIEWDKPMIDGMYQQKYSEIGPVFDVMFNLTNIVCGYKPNRWYNLSMYVGGGGYWSMSKTFPENIDKTEDIGSALKDGWDFNGDRVITFRGGIINSFNISKQVQLALDIRYSGIDNHKDEPGMGWNKTSHDLQAYLGVTYLFKKREWNAPIVPVCPEPEDCDPLRARLQAADARIADLEKQLKDCLEKPVPEPVVEEAPLATIYYPINVSKLTKKDVILLEAIADVMKANPDTEYVITGWADNYTGNDKINTRLRQNRVDGVKKQLVKFGVPASQVEATINHSNLVDLGEKYQALGRAVTIEEK